MAKAHMGYGIVLLSLLLMFVGCEGGARPVLFQHPQNQAGLPDELTSLALPNDRQVDDLTESLIPGKFTLDRSAGAMTYGTALLLDATTSGLEWGIYGFTPGIASLDSLVVQLDAAEGNQVWIGIGNYTRGSWEWHGPLSAEKVFAIDSSFYLSPGGLFAVAVVAAGQNTATVNALSIRTIRPENQPPKASLGANVLSGDAPLEVTFDASFSSDTDGQIIEYAWDWEGDGLFDGLSETAVVAHTFSPGIYTVRLRVTDDQFARDTTELEINAAAVGNNMPSADLQPATASGDTPLSVNFDATASDAGGDPGDSLLKYEWDLDGDGSYEGYGGVPTISHTYYVVGTYTAKLRVTDSAGNQATDTSAISVNIPGNVSPTANLSAWPLSGVVPFGVDFDASASSDSDGAIVRYDWDLDGDGNFEFYDGGAAPNWTYVYAGSAIAKVRVTDDKGAQDIDTVTISMNVPGNSPPTAVLSPSSAIGYFSLDVDFDASASSDSDGSIVLYEWDFDGDGNYDGYGQDATISHNYPAPGIFAAKLRVTDNLGAQTTDTSAVTVHNPSPGDWWMFGRDVQHMRRSPYAGPATNAMDWSYTTGGEISSSAAITADGMLYVGCEDNYLYAINADGSLNWRYGAGGVVSSSPAIAADGTVYVGSGNGKLLAINPNGSLKWFYSTGGQVVSSPVIGADGTVYVGSRSNSLFAINPDGSLKWTYTTTGQIYSCPAVGNDGTVYVGSYDHSLYAINSDGSLKWAYATGAAVYSSPALASDGTVYFGSLDDSVYALTSAGDLKWSYATAGYVFSSPAIAADGTMYIGSEDGKLYAFTPAGGLDWSYDTGESVDSAPAIDSDGSIYVGNSNGTLSAITPAGGLIWSFTADATIIASPAIGADGTVYIGSWDRDFYAFGPGSG